MRIWNCEFCEKWDFEMAIFVKMRFWKCEFCEKWDFKLWIFWINWGFLPQCESHFKSKRVNCILTFISINTIFRKWSASALYSAHQLFADANRISECMWRCWKRPASGILRLHTSCLLGCCERRWQSVDPSCQSTSGVLHRLKKYQIHIVWKPHKKSHFHTGAKINFLSRNHQEFDVWKNVNFVKIEISELWILWKMRLQKCEFCEKWDFRKVNLWELGLSICAFLDKMWIFAPACLCIVFKYRCNGRFDLLDLRWYCPALQH